MEVSEVKKNLGKSVFFKLPDSRKEAEYILTAYIYRVDHKNPKRRISQLELQDTKCGSSVLIAAIEAVKIKTDEV